MQDLNTGNIFPDWDEEEEPHYSLRLFITGASPVSVRAVSNIKTICETYLPGRYELEVVDIYQQPLLVADENITAIPVLIKKLPLPKKKLVGDMSDTHKVLKGLGIR
jgi:circadian clock protein KaiB